MKYINNKNKTLPILFLDGAVDPVNNKTKQTKKLIEKFNDKYENLSDKQKMLLQTLILWLGEPKNESNYYVF